MKFIANNLRSVLVLLGIAGAAAGTIGEAQAAYYYHHHYYHHRVYVRNHAHPHGYYRYY
jgi:hypothetical protein